MPGRYGAGPISAPVLAGALSASCLTAAVIRCQLRHRCLSCPAAKGTAWKRQKLRESIR